MSFGSVRLTHNDGTMHHLGIDETMVAGKVIVTPDPQEIPFYAALLENAEQKGDCREYVTFTGTYKGQPLSVMSCGFGCMPAAIAVEELNHLGVKEIIKIACCPAIQPETKIGSLVAASGAVRGEFASREYIDVSYPAVSDMDLLGRLMKAGVRQAEIFRSHDCRTLETPWAEGGPERIAGWAKLGVHVIDSETSAMFVISSILKVKTASLALIAENYADGTKLQNTDEARKELFHRGCGGADMLLIQNVLLPDFETLATQKSDVLIREGHFQKIAPHIEADCKVMDAHGMLMLPGMADIHTHMVQSLTKGPLDDLNITQWLHKMLAAQWSLSEEEWYWGVLLGCLQSLRFGVTAINEMTYFPHIDAVAQAYEDAGIRATFGIGATDIAENDQIKVTTVEECLRQAEYLCDRWHGKGLLRTSAVPQGRPACTAELMVALKDFAREHGLIYHTHLAEGRKETERVRSWTGRGEAEDLGYLGVLDENTILAHSIWLSDAEIQLLADTRAVVAHCPSSNMKLSDGAPRIAQMLKAGVRVGFGCDGEASSANRDLLREARHGSYLQKVLTLDATVLPAGQCYRMLTETGMEALGYRDLGKIREGWQADFSLVKTDDIATTNRRRILTNLLYAGSGYQIDAVCVAGNFVFENGKFLHHDLGKVLEKCEKILADLELRMERM